MLLLMILVLALQRDQNDVILGRNHTMEAHVSPDLHHGVVFFSTFTNEVEHRVRRHVFENVVFLDSCSV